MTFDPHYAIVTASDSGIGKATAVALAEAGMDVGITWHSDSKGAEETAEEVRSKGRKAVIKQLDYTDLPSCAGTIDLLIDALGGSTSSSTTQAPEVPHCWWTPPTTSGGRSSPRIWTAPSSACARPRST
jgi:NAD(P)-dependent dehydrogenase (short-subunit alcohol dehydrogenase family)